MQTQKLQDFFKVQSAVNKNVCEFNSDVAKQL